MYDPLTIYAAGRGRIAVRDNLSIQFLQTWGQMGYIEISGDLIAAERKA